MKIVYSLFTTLCFFQCALTLDIKELLGNEPFSVKRVVMDVLEYFQQDDPRGIPVLEIPEPLTIDGEHMVAGLILLKDPVVSGHSKLQLDYFAVDANNVKIEIRLGIPRLEVLSPYEWEAGGWFESKGDANITFTDLQIGAICNIGVDEEGYLTVDTIEVSVEKDIFSPDFTGLSVKHSAAVSLANTFFTSLILPAIKSRVGEKGKERLNKALKEKLKNIRFPIDMSPTDFGIATAKSLVIEKRNLTIDPFSIKEKVIDLPLPVTLKITNTKIYGLSTLHKTEDLKIEFLDNKIYIKLEIGTQDINIVTDYSLYSSLFPLGSGSIDLTVDSIGISIEVQQDADIRHPSVIRMVDVEIGNIALRTGGENNMNYLLEAVVNVLPNIVRNIILDKKLEEVIKEKGQHQLNSLDYHQMVLNKLG